MTKKKKDQEVSTERALQRLTTGADDPARQQLIDAVEASLRAGESRAVGERVQPIEAALRSAEQRIRQLEAVVASIGERVRQLEASLTDALGLNVENRMAAVGQLVHDLDKTTDQRIRRLETALSVGGDIGHHIASFNTRLQALERHVDAVKDK